MWFLYPTCWRDSRDLFISHTNVFGRTVLLNARFLAEMDGKTADSDAQRWWGIDKGYRNQYK
jgi:hypothetical protein